MIGQGGRRRRSVRWRRGSRSARRVLRADSGMVRVGVRGADPAPGRGLARHRGRRPHAGVRPHRYRQDAGRVSVGHRPAHVRRPARLGRTARARRGVGRRSPAAGRLGRTARARRGVGRRHPAAGRLGRTARAQRGVGRRSPAAGRLGRTARARRGVGRRGPVAGRLGRRCPGAVRVAAAGVGGGRGEEPAGPAARHPAGGGAAGRADTRADRGGAHRRHLSRRAAPSGAASARHPDHHARVAVPDAHQPGPGDPLRSAPRDHRRDPRGGGQQAGRPPDGVAGAAGGVVRPVAAAHRAVGHPAPAGGDRPVPGRVQRRAGRVGGSPTP